MEAWERWWIMAQGSLAAAILLNTQGEMRSSASRAYYAAYQAATALLLYSRQVPPGDREAWSHEATPTLLQTLPDRIASRALQKDLGERLRTLYGLRLIADYQGEAEIDAKQAQFAVRSAAFVAKSAASLFP